MYTEHVLITGAAGFAGTHLARRLIAEGKDRKIILQFHHRPLPKELSEHPNVIPVQGSLTDYAFMTEVISKHEITTIYHLASNSIVRKCANDPYNAYLTNVMGTVTLLEAVRNVGMNTVKKIIISTSDKAYGHATPPYSEGTPFAPKFTYDATKACQDIVAQNYFHNYGLPINIIRSENVYGPHDPNMSRLIPNSIKSIRNDTKPILFSGTKDYVRGFVFIDDFIDALLIVQSKAQPGEAYCVGGDEAVSIEELTKRICSLMQFDKGIDIVEKPSVFKEIEKQSIDNTKLKQLGWVNKFTLEKGLLETIEKFKL